MTAGLSCLEFIWLAWVSGELCAHLLQSCAQAAAHYSGLNATETSVTAVKIESGVQWGGDVALVDNKGAKEEEEENNISGNKKSVKYLHPRRH